MSQVKEKEKERKIEVERKKDIDPNKIRINEENFKILEKVYFFRMDLDKFFKKYIKETEFTAKLRSDIAYLKKENTLLKKNLEESENREKDLLIKIKSLKNHIRELEENRNKLLQHQSNSKNSLSSIPSNSFPPIINNSNEKSLRKKCKSKEDLSPSVKLITEKKNCNELKFFLLINFRWDTNLLTERRRI